MHPTEHRFQLIHVLLEAIVEGRALVEKLHRHDRHIADQIKRALTRAPLLAAEANKHRDGNRTAKLRLCAGEVDEARVGLQTAVCFRHVMLEEIASTEARLEQASKMLHRLLR
jgi:four helix bundle protein